MRKRPWPIVILAIIHIFAPIFNILFSGLFNGFGVIESFSQALHFQNLAANLHVFLLPVLAGLSIYACKKWSFYTYVLCKAGLLFFNFQSISTDQTRYGYINIAFLFALNILVVGYFLVPAVRNLYFSRRARWWENHTRYIAGFNCEWSKAESKKSVTGVVENISIGGLFLNSANVEVKSDDLISINFKCDKLSFKFLGKPIIHQKTASKGFGIQFFHSKDSLKNIKKLVAHLEEKGLRSTNLPNTYEDSFSYWLKKVLTSGRGLLPEASLTKS